MGPGRRVLVPGPGILNGRGGGILAPAPPPPGRELAVMLQRYLELPREWNPAIPGSGGPGQDPPLPGIVQISPCSFPGPMLYNHA